MTHLDLAETDLCPPTPPPVQVRACEEAARLPWKAACKHSGCTGRGRRGLQGGRKPGKQSMQGREEEMSAPLG